MMDIDEEMDALAKKEAFEIEIGRIEEWTTNIKKPPLYKFNKNRKLLLHIFNDYRHLCCERVRYLAKKINVAYKTLQSFLIGEKSLGIDKAIKLSYTLMIPEVEMGFNLNRRPPTYYIGGFFLPSDENLEGSCVGIIHSLIRDEGLVYKLTADKYKVFKQKVKLTKCEKRLLRASKIISKAHLHRIISNKQVPTVDKCMRMIIFLNRYSTERQYKIKDFWWLEKGEPK